MSIGMRNGPWVLINETWYNLAPQSLRIRHENRVRVRKSGAGDPRHAAMEIQSRAAEALSPVGGTVGGVGLLCLRAPTILSSKPSPLTSPAPATLNPRIESL